MPVWYLVPHSLDTYFVAAATTWKSYSIVVSREGCFVYGFRLSW